MYKVIVKPDAELDLADAFAWYESQKSGLGEEFLNEVKTTTDRVQLYPESCSAQIETIRRCLLRKFPYGIFYTIENDIIYILAIFHNKKDPVNWNLYF